MHELLPNLFTLHLEERPQSPNTIDLYLFKNPSDHRSLLLDTGYGTPSCQEALFSTLQQAGLSPDQLDVFLTHKHADHCGLAHALQARGALCRMNPEEDRHLYDCLYYRLDHSAEAAQLRVLRRTGITETAAPLIWQKFMDFNRHLQEEHSIWLMTIEDFAYQPITPDETFDIGDYHLRALPLRGHSFGQMGLADDRKKLLFCGDQVLNRTTPIVGTSHADEHLLKLYFESLDTLEREYSAYLFLPAHEGPIDDLPARLAHIRAAYRRKLDQALACVAAHSEVTVWQATREVYGLTPDKRSDWHFYNAKMTNTKTFSLLEYLYDCGEIRRREEDGTLYYFR